MVMPTNNTSSFCLSSMKLIFIKFSTAFFTKHHNLKLTRKLFQKIVDVMNKVFNDVSYVFVRKVQRIIICNITNLRFFSKMENTIYEGVEQK